MVNNDSDMDEIYGCPYMDSDAERLALKKKCSKGGVRLKTIKSGMMLESEIFPVWDNAAKGDSAKTARSAELEQKYYQRRQRKRLERIINTNFGEGDSWCKLGYRPNALPRDAHAADKNMINFLRRLAEYCKRHKLPRPKYVYITEELSKGGEVVRIHHHLVCNFKDRTLLERMWTHEDRTNCKRVVPDINGLGGMAGYILKNIKGRKTYHTSTGLRQPTVHRADCKITSRELYRMASNRVYCEDKLSKIYKGYTLIEVKVMVSDIVSGSYIYAKFRKIESRSTAKKEDIYKSTNAIKPSRLKVKLSRINAIDKELASLRRELVGAKTTHIAALKEQINAANKQRGKLLMYFDDITKKLEPNDRAILRDRYILSKSLIELARLYGYAGSSSVSRRISMILDMILDKKNYRNG